MAARLRAVTDADKAPARKKFTVKTAAAEGDRLDLLIAMRDRIATAVTATDCPPRDLAALTRRLDDIADKIAALEAAAEADDGDSEPAEDEVFDASAI